MKNKMKVIAAFMVVLLMAGRVSADFAQTPLYFTVPLSISFSILTMTASSYTNSTNSSVQPYPPSETYYFNTTSATNGTMVPPCTGGASPKCQSGNSNVPGWQVQNTGNVNISIGLWLNNSIALSGITLCANSSKTTGCGGAAQQPNCNAGPSQGILNNSVSRIYATQISPITSGGVCFYANVSVFANFSSAAFGTDNTVGLIFNSTVS